MKKTRLSEKIFSVKDSLSKTHKIVVFLGLRLEFKRRIKNIKADFEVIFKNLRKNSVLVAEPNGCHYEVVPGFAKYFSDLGYNVDVIVRDGKELGFLTESDKDIKVYSAGENLGVFLQDERIRGYKYIVFTSSVKYMGRFPGNSPNQPLVTDCFKNMAFDFDKVLFVQHHLERTLASRRQIALADLKNKYSQNFYMVNPHYFGKVEITPKNENITKFIVVGNIDLWRKNYSLLLDAVRKLATKRENFKIILVGGGGSLEIAADIAGFFDVRGRLSYPDMFRAMEEADFFLCLLDPENPEHERYVTTGTSGSFQLIYGFAKPCLIHRYFAKVYDFDDGNALVYDDNRDLARLMERAVAMDAKEYENIQQGVCRKEEDIKEKSLANLKRILQTSK